MVNIEFKNKHNHTEFSDLEQGAFFTLLTEIPHILYIKTEFFNINSAADLGVNAIQLNTGKGYYIKPTIIIVNYNGDIMLSEVQ